jgi:hypothetical protein
MKRPDTNASGMSPDHDHEDDLDEHSPGHARPHDLVSFLVSFSHVRGQTFTEHHSKEATQSADPLDLRRTQPHRLGKRVGTIPGAKVGPRPDLSEFGATLLSVLRARGKAPGWQGQEAR